MKIPHPFFPALTAALVSAVVLDANAETGPIDQKLHVVYLYHADCRDVADTLRQLVDRAQADVAHGRPGTALSGEPTVLPDEPTNSLVIAASPLDFDLLSRVIRKLDTRRDRVRLEMSVLHRDASSGGFRAGVTQTLVVSEHEEVVLPIEGLASPMTVSALISSDREVNLRLAQGGCDDEDSMPLGCRGVRLVSVTAGDGQTMAVRFETAESDGLLLHDSADLHALLGGAVAPGADPELVVLITPMVVPDPTAPAADGARAVVH